MITEFIIDAAHRQWADSGKRPREVYLDRQLMTLLDEYVAEQVRAGHSKPDPTSIEKTFCGMVVKESAKPGIHFFQSNNNQK